MRKGWGFPGASATEGNPGRRIAAALRGWWLLLGTSSSPLPPSCLGHQKEADGEDADGGTVAAAPIHSEAVLRPVAGVAVTWLTSVWHTWKGQPICGQDSFSSLSHLQITWYVYGKSV